SWSTVGAIIRHGPHQAAQKSTKTGTWELSTSCSKLSSVTARAFPMASPKSGTYHPKCSVDAPGVSGDAVRMQVLENSRRFGGASHAPHEPAVPRNGIPPGVPAGRLP